MVTHYAIIKQIIEEAIRDHAKECYGEEEDYSWAVEPLARAIGDRLQERIRAQQERDMSDAIRALRAMLALWEDVCKSNSLGKMCFQDYANLNEAPIMARDVITRYEGAKS